MTQPETNVSLLIRIRDSQDRDAWEQFVSIYRPAIVRLAKKRGLQNADSEDLAQRVLFSVSKSIQSWRPDSTRASFRTWLNRVTQNAVLNALTRGKPDQGTGNTNIISLLERGRSEGDSTILNLEVRREVFRFAAKEIESEFHSLTWQAFWLTAVDEITVEAAAKQLGKSAGSVYAARSRVMRRLREKIQELQLMELDTE